MNYQAFVMAASIYDYYQGEEESRRKRATRTFERCIKARELMRSILPDVEINLNDLAGAITIILPKGTQESYVMSIIRKIHGNRFYLHRCTNISSQVRYDISYTAQNHMIIGKVVMERFNHSGFVIMEGSFAEKGVIVQLSSYDVIEALEK